MNIIFLTLLDFKSYSEHNIYCDLIREFIKNGHDVYCISPVEKRTGIETHFEENKHLLKLKIGNTQKTNVIEKGISTLMIEPMFVSAIKKYFSNIKFDLILYSTPPITFAKVIDFIKKRDCAKTYLMLKDIFPQNAVDMGMMSTSGLKGILYRYFRKKEKFLYSISDYIGCMSDANIDYVLKNNPEISRNKVGLCPNCIEIVDLNISEEEKRKIRKKYDIPTNKKVFVYGGNLGKPQGISFLIDCLRSQESNDDIFFLIVGDGTEYHKLDKYVNESNPKNVKLMKKLPKDDYDRMIAACDVGMIFLDYRFTIPNFPSRLLAYMQASIPILACTDTNTDIGKVIVEGGFGWWCYSKEIEGFVKMVNQINQVDLKQTGLNSFDYLEKNYSVKDSYCNIINHLRGLI